MVRIARALGLASCLAAGAFVCADELDGALSKLETSSVQDGRATLVRSIEVIRAEMVAGDADTWQRLRGIMLDPSLPYAVRLDVLSLSAEKANESMASGMLVIATTWADALATSPLTAGQPAPPESRATALLLGRFIHLAAQPQWTRWVGGRQETLDLIENVILGAHCSLETKSEALKLLAASTAPIERRRAVAEAVVAARPRSTQPAGVILALLGESSLPKLRELARRSDDPDTFHYAAAAALAHLGDREILGDLESRRPAFRQKHVNLEGYLIYYIWQINIQHPVSNLLDYIASTERLPAVETRMWAVRRAVELAIPKEKIREALLKHAKQVKPKNFRERSGRTVKLWPGLSSLKQQGLTLGILHAEDLAEVRVPKVPPTP